jgi:hypothetical protein
MNAPTVMVDASDFHKHQDCIESKNYKQEISTGFLSKKKTYLYRMIGTAQV